MSGVQLNILDRLVAAVAPRAGLRRAASRAALMHYQASDLHRRDPSVRANGGDADLAAQGSRETLAWISRDVTRNNPTAARALSVIGNNVVGTGIEPRLITKDKGLQREWNNSILPRLDSLAFDGDGALSLGALQLLVLETMARDGECLVVWPDDGQRGAQVRVLEIDYLDDSLMRFQGPDGSVISDGIEYGADGRVRAYYLFAEHPGSPLLWKPGAIRSQRVDAGRVLHLFRVDRPGQRRGVSWFAPVLDDLAALSSNDKAQLLRQQIAACFAVFWRSEKTREDAGIPLTISPGMIQQIGVDDEVSFGNPPDVQGYDDFAKVHLRRVAVGLGITYEALTGDLSNVNFSSARLGRIDMGQNIDRWQWHLMIPRLCRPLGSWILRQWAYDAGDAATLRALREARIDWTPPPPVIADPKTETEVAVRKIEAGLASRHGEIRRMGWQPDKIDAEIVADMPIRRDLAALKQPGAAPVLGEQDDTEGQAAPSPDQDERDAPPQRQT